MYGCAPTRGYTGGGRVVGAGGGRCVEGHGYCAHPPPPFNLSACVKNGGHAFNKTSSNWNWMIDKQAAVPMVRMIFITLFANTGFIRFSFHR